MGYFVVLGTYGPARQADVPLKDEPGWDDHAAFMDQLADRGVVLLAGPFGTGDRILLVTSAESREVVIDELARDPWRASGTLLPPEVEPWDVRIGDPERARGE